VDPESVAVGLNHGKEGSIMRRTAHCPGIGDEAGEVDLNPGPVF
jgi:hypothetical protein